jgi:hypothetical protein
MPKSPFDTRLIEQVRRSSAKATSKKGGDSTLSERSSSAKEKALAELKAIEKELVAKEKRKLAAIKAKETRERHEVEKRLQLERDKEEKQCFDVLAYIIEAAMKGDNEVVILNGSLEKIGVSASEEVESIAWNDLESAGFRVRFDRFGARIDWKQLYYTDVENIKYLWIDGYEIQGLTESSEVLSRALRDVSANGSNKLGLVCEFGTWPDELWPTISWRFTVTGSNLGMQLPTLRLSPSRMAKIFKLLGFNVKADWHTPVENDGDLDAEGGGGQLIVSWS